MDFAITAELSEIEARALKAITDYGTDNFLRTFYNQFGRDALKPHEIGLIELFNTIRTEMPKHLDKIDDIREIWEKK